MVKLFPDAYFHIGGDEVNPREWNNEPRIRAVMSKHHPNIEHLKERCGHDEEIDGHRLAQVALQKGTPARATPACSNAPCTSRQ